MTIPSIYKNARDGRLNEESLNQYIKPGEDINAASGNKQYIPLMAAVLNGHKNTVKLLLSNKADVNRQAPSGETALWPKIGSHNTPLMQAIVRFGDTKVVSLLVDAGASLGALNRDGKTASELVAELRSHKLDLALHLLDEKRENQVPTTSKTAKLIAYVIFWLSMIFAFIPGALGALKGCFGASSSPSIPVSELEQPMFFFRNVTLRQGDQGDMGDTGLHKSAFLETNPGFGDVGEPKSPLNTQENLKVLILLKIYQPILYHDSSSMRSPTIQNRNITRIAAKKDIVQGITHIPHLIIAEDDDIHVRFINKDVYCGKPNCQIIRKHLDTVEARGTDSGTNLEA